MPRDTIPADRTRRVEAATNPLKDAFKTPGAGESATSLYERLAKDPKWADSIAPANKKTLPKSGMSPA